MFGPEGMPQAAEPAHKPDHIEQMITDTMDSVNMTADELEPGRKPLTPEEVLKQQN
jgi:hypothetical protein